MGSINNKSSLKASIKYSAQYIIEQLQRAYYYIIIVMYYIKL